MKTHLVAVTCALCLGACAGSDNRPVQDPTSEAASASAPSSTHDAGRSPALRASATPGSDTSTQARNDDRPVPPHDFNDAGAAPQHAAVLADPGPFDQTKSADNTTINERDRDALTPMDQGGSKSETDITAAIRRGLMGDKTLSFTAKNVKIITVGTKVTLRGPVKSDRERGVVETLAKQTAGVDEVDDKLEVKK
jgi:hypothetical protein